MKKTVLLGACALAALFLSSCRKKTEGDLLAQIKEKGKLTIAMEGTWAPWTYHDENDVLTGYDVEVGRRIAEKLGVEADFVEAEWDGIFAGIDSKRYDISLNGIEITEERSKKYDFSDPYAFTHTVLIVRKENEDIKTFEDLKGKKSSNTIGSTYAETAEAYGAEVSNIDSFEETLQLVEHGRVDATLNDSATFYYYQMVHPDNNFKAACVNPNASLVAIPVRKGKNTASFRLAVNNAIEELKQSGELTALAEKYFGKDISR